MKKRKAMLAGSWYPNKAHECEVEIENFLTKYKDQNFNDTYIGGIVPHAGWFFSGDLACNVIKSLANTKDDEKPDVIIIYGMHLHQNSDFYIIPEGLWETPFGDLEIEDQITSALLNEYKDIFTQSDFSNDNTIELQTAFIKYFFDDVKIVPIGIAPNKYAKKIGQSIADILTNLNLKAKIIGSTDLTHYGSNYGFTSKGLGKEALDWVKNENDANIIKLILEMDAETVLKAALKNGNACCSGAVAATITTIKALGAKKAKLIDYTTSYDKNPSDSFVGYTGICFY